MRIAMFNDNFYPEMSGISDSIIESAKELVKLGHEVDFYVPKYTKKDYQAVNLPEEELDLGEGIRIHRFSSMHASAGTGQGRMVVPYFLRWLSMRADKPDVIHIHLCFGTDIEGLVASRCLGVPLVGTNHTPITEFLKYGPVQNKLIDKMMLRYVSWLYNRCRFVSAPCEVILKEMRENGFKNPHRVIPNPVDLKNFSPPSAEEKAAIKKELGLSDFTVLYTGRISEEKHVDVVIRAVAKAAEKIPEINLAITGHGTAEDDLKKLAESLGMKDRIKFFGTLPVPQYVRVHKAAEMFAIASTSDMQSLSLMKAYASGMPAVGVNSWALPEYIKENVGFIVEPGDFEGMAEKILYFHDNPAEREKMGQEGVALVKDFSPTNIAKIWEKIYEEAIKKK